MKCIKVRHNTTHIVVVFKDVLNFISGGTLAEFVKCFGNGQSSKGVFPYESFNTSNYQSVLDSTIVFPRSDFHSFLKNTDMTEEQYNNYLEDWQSLVSSRTIKNRWDYLRHYNINDVEIMIPAVNTLINNLFQDKVDMLHSFSLASNASAVKYSYAYKDFRIDGDYSSSMPDTPYQLTLQKFSKKCDTY
jgi:hypothetical protein